MKKILIFFTAMSIFYFAASCQNNKIVTELAALRAESITEGKNKEIVRQWLSEIDKENFDIVDELISENCTAYYSGDTLGREWLRNSCKTFPHSFSNSMHIIDDLIAEKDKVIARLTIKATHTGPFMGASPTGKAVDYNAFTIYRIEDGKIQEIWVDHNAVYGLMKQLDKE